jgi:hypothetical protein
MGCTALRMQMYADEEIGTEISYSKKFLDVFDVQVKTDHNLSGGNLEVTNDTVIDGKVTADGVVATTVRVQ